MGLFGSWKKLGKRTEKKRTVDAYSGMRVEVTDKAGKLLFVAKFQHLDGKQAELQLYTQAFVSQDSEPIPALLRGYSDHERKAVYMEGVVFPVYHDRWSVVELEVKEVKNDRAFFRLEVDLEGTATMFSGLEMGEKPCLVQNVSVGGAGIRSKSRYHRGDKLLLKMKLREDQPVSAIFGQVVRVMEKEDGFYDYGCQFMELTEKDQERITQNIYEFQQRVKSSSVEPLEEES